MRESLIIAALVAAAIPATVSAELVAGAKAPDFTTQAALAGKVMPFSLKAALKKGPVVMFFYPEAFTGGCTLQTKAFAESYDKFKAAHATVVGMSADDLPKLQRFSTEACANKFPVGVATPAIVKAYDVEISADDLPAQYRANFKPGSGRTARTSYVIAPDGRVKLVHSQMDYRDHVKVTLEAVQALSKH